MLRYLFDHLVIWWKVTKWYIQVCRLILFALYGCVFYDTSAENDCVRERERGYMRPRFKVCVLKAARL
jgi:hypothetical protein